MKKDNMVQEILMYSTGLMLGFICSEIKGIEHPAWIMIGCLVGFGFVKLYWYLYEKIEIKWVKK